jgi:REP element-mobilizing transposase RayT
VRPEVYALRSKRSFRAIEKALRGLGGLPDARVVHYSIQGNHIHLIVEAENRLRLSRRIQGLEVRMARALNKMMRRPHGRVFADRYHAHILKTPREVHRALGYVLRNAEKHHGARHGTFVDPYSSAAWFHGWSRPVRIGWSPLDERAPPISAPDTWLLKTGWKKQGLLDPRQTPS